MFAFDNNKHLKWMLWEGKIIEGIIQLFRRPRIRNSG